MLVSSRKGRTAMSQEKITRKETKIGETTYSATTINLGNAYIALLCEGEENLGTLAVSLPQKKDMIGPPVSSLLLGDRNTTIARVFAERLAATLGKMALVSIFVKTLDERKVANVFWDLLEKALKKEATDE